MEVVYFEESVRTKKRQQMVTESLALVYPAYQAMLGHLRSEALNRFKKELEEAVKNGEGFAFAVRHYTESCMEEFDQGCSDAKVEQANWDLSKSREKLKREIDAYAASVCATLLSEIKNKSETQLTEALGETVASLLESALPDTWPSIRKLLKNETEKAILNFKSAISGFEIDDDTTYEMVESLKDYGRSVVEKKAREEAGQVLIHMKDRFSIVFSHDNESMPRVWTRKVDIRAITKNARSASLKLLAVMAALRLDEKPDNIEATLSSALTDGIGTAGSLLEGSSSSSVNPLVSNTWEGFSPSDVLITPVQCKSLWRQFKSETEYTVGQALAAQEANRRNSSWLPPPWVLVALVVLGFNEFMTLLRNPIYIGVIFVLYLLGKALFVQLDIAGEFQHGFLSGILSLSAKFLPTIMALLKRLADEGQKFSGSETSSNTTLLRSENYGVGFKEVQLQDPARSSPSQSSSVEGVEPSQSIRHRHSAPAKATF